MISLRLGLFVGLLTVSLVAGAQATAPFSLRISVPHEAVRSGDPIIVDLFVTNRLDHSVMLLSDGYPEERYYVEVTDAAGANARMTDRYAKLSSFRGLNGPPNKGTYIDQNGVLHRQALKGHNAALQQIMPGAEIKDSTDLGRLYFLGQPGTYTVHFEISDPDTHIRIKSNTVTVTVTRQR